MRNAESWCDWTDNCRWWKGKGKGKGKGKVPEVYPAVDDG